MTEELENKLNELLGLKKQLEELTAEKKMSDDELLQKYKRQGTVSKIIYNALGATGTFIVAIGLICMMMLSKHQLFFLFFAIVGYMIVLYGEINFRITKSKLAILQEMKQFELRLTDMLKK